MDNSVKEPNVDVPFGLPESKHVHFRLMYDLMALAFQGDITRSATFMLGRDLTGTSFPESGFNGGWHGSSHHGDKPENVANYAKMNRYHVQNLAYFCDKLQNIARRRRHAARSRADLQGQQHGQFASARARESAGDPGRWHRRDVQGESSHRVPGQHAADVESAVEHPAPVRHRAGQDRDEHRTAAGHRAALASRRMQEERSHDAGRRRRLAPWRADGRSSWQLPRWRRSPRNSAESRRDRRWIRPRGRCRQVIFKNCTSCHGIDDYAYNALDRAGWNALIDTKHKDLSVRIAGQDRELLLDWVVARFGPDSRPFPRAYVPPEITTFFSDAEAQALLGRACTTCHGLDRVNETRYSPDKWRVTALDMRQRGAKLDRRGAGTPGRVAGAESRGRIRINDQHLRTTQRSPSAYWP